jgi:hypothetical protein
MNWAARFVADRRRRIGMYIAILIACLGIFVWGLADPGGFFDGPRDYSAFIVAPFGIVLFGYVLTRELRGRR